MNTLTLGKFINGWNHVYHPRFGSRKAIKNGKQPQKQSGKTLRTFPRKPEDSKLDFNASLNFNYKLIRATSRPFSGAYAYLNGTKQKVTIFKAKPYLVEYDFCNKWPNYGTIN